MSPKHILGCASSREENEMEYFEMNEISENLSYHLFIKFVQPLNYFQTK